MCPKYTKKKTHSSKIVFTLVNQEKIAFFNARTAKFSDFIIADENLLHDILDITDDEMNENMYTYHILEQLNITLERNNEDEGRTNPYGMKLLD